MKAMILRPDLTIEIADLKEDGGLEQLTNILGGPIEMPYLGEMIKGFDLIPIVNEEGKLQQLPPSVVMDDNDGNPVEVIAGPMILLSSKGPNELNGINELQFTLFSMALESGSFYTIKHTETQEDYKCFAIPAYIKEK